MYSRHLVIATLGYALAIPLVGQQPISIHPINGSATPGVAASGPNGITYHGGKVLLGTANVYLIWYGNWSGNSATGILTDLVTNLGGSPYLLINTTYYDAQNQHVSGAVRYAGSTNDFYSQGTALTTGQIPTIVSSAISSGRLPSDANGIYFVLTSKDVTLGGFCSSNCGWHTSGTIAGTTIRYSFIGNPDQCPSVCAAQTATSPNGNVGADGMASVLAHELEETLTDPDITAWYDLDAQGNFVENADRCAWSFGSEYTAPNGARANMRIGSRDYLIQQNWLNANGGACVLSYTSTPSTSFQTLLSVFNANPPGGQPFTVGETVTNNGPDANDVIVDVEGFNAAGQKVCQDFREHQNLAAGARAGYSLTCTPPTGFSGTIALSGAVFSSGWQANLHWNDKAVTVTVGAPPPVAHIDYWWPSPSGVTISGRQPVKVYVQELDGTPYSALLTINNGSPIVMGDSTQDWPHKETSIDFTPWAGQTVTLTVEIRDANNNYRGKAATPASVVK